VFQPMYRNEEEPTCMQPNFENLKKLYTFLREQILHDKVWTCKRQKIIQETKIFWVKK